MLTHKELNTRAFKRADVKAEYEKYAHALGCHLELRLVR
jgi:hypothetical protein